MPLHIIIGAQWGDEGKGRILDAIAAEAAVVARFAGGDNAGHTVAAGGKIFRLHLVPSGIVHPRPLCILGSGMVINPQRLLAEMAALREQGVVCNPDRIRISHAAHLLTPLHIELDRAEEATRENRIGTTGRGIGPAFSEKSARCGLRAELLASPEECAEKIKSQILRGNRILEKLYSRPPLDAEAVAASFFEYARTLGPYVADTSALVAEALGRGETVLAEGAQGTLLDLDQGTYPFVTSSNTGLAGVFSGLGVGARALGRVIGVVKAFQTRVGEGPFPTEEAGEIGDRLRGTGSMPWDEYGTTTRRPRRCGWLDLMLLRYSVRQNGLTELVLTKLDILSGLNPVRLCGAYLRDGKKYHELPMGLSGLGAFQPVYEDLPGWEADIRKIRKKEDLPEAARKYIERIEREAGVPVSLVSVGSEREDIIPWK
ncbi:MAG: adenylosuccinate synthase [Anaerolineales bacterium]|nr:adenylosuccinate synthase [Anaerolineales bacterium]